MFWSLANNHNVSDGLKGVTYTQAIIIISYQHITIHSKSKKVCGTAFSVKKNAEKVRVIFGPFWVILGPFWTFLGHLWAI